jgi:hypothetical protein
VKLLLERYIHDKGFTIGRLLSGSDRVLVCYMVERAATGEHPRIPCGTYECVEYVSGRIKRAKIAQGMSVADAEVVARVWLLKDVPGRKWIEIHTANIAEELLGCLAPGMALRPKKDGVLRSRVALDKLTSFVGGWKAKWSLEIVNV